jgi:hypothetical protein
MQLSAHQLQQVRNHLQAALAIVDAKAIQALERDPSLFTPDGKFSEKGVARCYELFEDGLDNPTIAKQLAVSEPAIRHRRALWRKQKQSKAD